MFSSTLSLTPELDGVGGQRHAPAALSPGKTRYPLYRRLGEPQGRSGWMRKISPPPGFGPWTAQPVASRYTDWAIPAAHTNWGYLKEVVSAQENNCGFRVEVTWTGRGVEKIVGYEEIRNLVAFTK